MSNWMIFFNILFAGVIIYFLVQNLRAHPEWLERASLSKSFSVMGMLALILIAFVGACVFMLKR